MNIIKLNLMLIQPVFTVLSNWVKQLFSFVSFFLYETKSWGRV